MMKFISASSVLFATALMVTLSLGCGGVGDTSGSSELAAKETNNGTCNSIVARTLGTAQQCSNGVCSAEQCAELLDTFNAFFGSDCAGAFFAGELNGLPGSALKQPNGPNAGDPKHIEEVICAAAEACDPTCTVIQTVGLCLETDACP